METTIVLLILLCAAVESGMIRRFHFIDRENDKRWHEAQTHCREHYTDLAFIDNVTDDEDLSRASDTRPAMAWIGLYKEIRVWKWSGGRSVNYTNWASGKPDNILINRLAALIYQDGKWDDSYRSPRVPFYCYSLFMVEEEAKTWEAALEHCRDRDSDLMILRRHTSFSRSDLREQLEMIQSQRVWIGLRFLRDRWLWVSGNTWMRPDWTTADEEHQCPTLKRCGALTKEGLWENWDCQEKLPFICDSERSRFNK